MNSIDGSQITIITCSLNQAPFLEETINSVVNQRNVGIEYIVIDGASCDGSVEIIKAKSASIAFWASESDNGQSSALNKGLRRASSPIVGWLCSDDILLPGALEEIVSFFKENPEVEAVYGNAVLIDEYGKFIKSKKEIGFYPWILSFDHNYIPQPSMFWRKSIHDRIGYLNEELHLTMDLEFWLRMAQGNIRVKHVDKFWSAMRCHSAQKVFTQTEALINENIALRHIYGANLLQWLPFWFAHTMARVSRISIRMLSLRYFGGIPKIFVAHQSKASTETLK